ncbi:MAG: hypothetical protein HC882_07630 [Acidobacteria bacterium]|nr:hypothetical protein [Acidobacteriota bacterium]
MKFYMMKVYILAIAIPQCSEPIIRAFQSGESRDRATKEWLRDNWNPENQQPSMEDGVDIWLRDFDPDLTFGGDIDLFDVDVEL